MGYPLNAAQWVEARRVAIEPDPAVLSLVRQLSVARPVCSAELGRSKPDLEAFRRLAYALDELLYVGDDATYVAGAREAGLSAYHVGGAAGVRTGLAVHGLDRW
jgi:FMN phosphatase YigB (HAD superfamily)